MSALRLIGDHLCPFAERVAIVLGEKSVPFRRHYIDLSNKPDWFLALSPLGKVPLLEVSDDGHVNVIFESAVILEYLEETIKPALHPSNALERARHRAWIEFGSSILMGISRFYNAETEKGLRTEAQKLSKSLSRVEAELNASGWFGGEDFSLVDVVYAPIFRYFDVFDQIADFGVLSEMSKIKTWRASLAGRPSVMEAAVPDYHDRLLTFLRERPSFLSSMVAPDG